MATTNPCYYKSIRNPHELIRKAVELIEDPLSSDYIDRHVQIIDDFLDACSYAVWLHDVPYVIKLLYSLADKVDFIPKYRRSFIKLLNLCRVPPLLVKTSEIFMYEEDIAEYFSAFGYLLVKLKDNNEVFSLTLQILRNLCQETKVGICCINNGICNKALAKSPLPKIISELMCIVDDKIYYKLLESMEYLISSDETCIKFLRNDIPNIILTRMCSEWDKSNHKMYGVTEKINITMKYFDLIMRILWRLLNVIQTYPNICGRQLITSEAWRNIQRLLRALSTLNMKKLKRNTLVTLILLILKITKLNVTCGVADDLSLLCALPEIDAGITWASKIVVTHDVLDYDFKKLLFLVITYYPKDPELARFLRERKIVPCILRIITPEVNVVWNEKQRCKIMGYSLLALCEIMEIVFDDFVSYAGPRQLLKMIEAFMKTQLRQGSLDACLYCIHRSLNMKNINIAETYRSYGGFDILIELLKYLINLNTLSIPLQNSMNCSFCILEILNRRYECSRPDVISMCFEYLKRYLKPNKTDLILDPRVLISCLDFIWENLTWSVSNLKQFIDDGGTYLLLDIIEVNCFPVQLIALSMLIDLCEEGSCIPFLLTWRGNNKTAMSMFLEIFRRENKKIGVKSTNKGLISDVELPLMGQKQFDITFRIKKSPNASPSTIDMLGSCRPKIYALIQILYCNQAEVVEVVNERYKISSFPLSINDQITKLLAENYLPLKLGEVWIELKRDLEIAGIQPLAYDQEMIATMVRRFYKWSMHIKKTQEELFEKENQQNIIEEQIFYSRLNQAFLSEALDALDDLRYIARCTENVFRLMSKMKQTDQLKRSLDYDPEFYIKFHTTFLHSIAVTPVFNQKVSIRSNVIVEPNHQIISVEPVSPSCSMSEIKVQESNRSRESEPDICILSDRSTVINNNTNIKKLT